MSEVKKLDFRNLLGEGRYGKVFLGDWDEVKVAIKRVEISNTQNNGQEEEAMRKLNHPNVIKLFNVESDEVFRYYYLELCHTSLEKLFLGKNRKYFGPLPSDNSVLYQLAIGLEYIHQNGLIHRDLKPENVLIWVNPETGEVVMKWADFGLSKPVNETGSYSMTTVKGTLEWLAPELLKILDEINQSESKLRQRGTVKSDVFAEGLIFGYYLLNSDHPFGSSRFQIQSNILANKPANVDKIRAEFARNLIKEMLKENPENRITASAVVQQLKSNRTKRHQINIPFLKNILRIVNNLVARFASRITHVANDYDEQIYAQVDTTRLKEEEEDFILSSKWGLVQKDDWPGIHDIYLGKVLEYFKGKSYKTIEKRDSAPFFTNAPLSDNVFITIASSNKLICLNYEVQVNRSVIVDRSGQIQKAKYETGPRGESRISTDHHGKTHGPASKRKISSADDAWSKLLD